jgi:hypothetical protein
MDWIDGMLIKLQGLYLVYNFDLGKAVLKQVLKVLILFSPDKLEVFTYQINRVF